MPHACQHRRYVQHNSCMQMQILSLGYRIFSKHKLVCLCRNHPIHINPKFYHKSITTFHKLCINEEGRKKFFWYRWAHLTWNIQICHSDCCWGTWADWIWKINKKLKVQNYFYLFVIFRMKVTILASGSTVRVSCHKALPE